MNDLDKIVQNELTLKCPRCETEHGLQEAHCRKCSFVLLESPVGNSNNVITSLSPVLDQIIKNLGKSPPTYLSGFREAFLLHLGLAGYAVARGTTNWQKGTPCFRAGYFSQTALECGIEIMILGPLGAGLFYFGKSIILNALGYHVGKLANKHEKKLLTEEK